MTDDLDALKYALRAIPAPDPDARAKALQLAMKNFDDLQGSADPSRPTADRPQRAGILWGVMTMFKSMNSRPLLAATTSAAALMIGFAVVLPLTQNGLVSNLPEAPPEQAELRKPEATVAVDSIAQGASGQTAVADAPVMADDAAPKLSDNAAPAPKSAAKRSVRLDDGLILAAPEMARESDMAAIATEAAPLSQRLDDTEEFASAPANPVKVTVDEPVSTFSIDVDTASYAVVRSSLNAGFLPDPLSVRIEEMVNYFPYAYPGPDVGQPFRSTVTVMPTPWNSGTRLVHIGIQGELPAIAERPPLNLVFLIDTSGSMDEPNKLPLLKQSLGLMLGQLRPDDQIAIVAYAGSAGQVLAPTAASDRAVILTALDNLAAGGSTAGAEGLALAYQVADSMAADGEVSRVLLATDGDFNVGIDDPEALKTYIAGKRDSGVYLSVLGFGRGNLDDATMQALAQNGNGQAAYIDTLNEARKVLVDQLTGALYPIANNVKIQIEWNPAAVAEYRLIGYETRSLRREDFNNDRIDAGDIGAGHSVTAIYEVTAPDSPALLNDPLRYGAAEPALPASELGFLRLRYVAPGGTASKLLETPIQLTTAAASDDTRFAVAMAGFGQLLTGATYLGDWGWDAAIELALSARGADDFGYRIEAVNLMRLGQSLSGQ